MSGTLDKLVVSPDWLEQLSSGRAASAFCDAKVFPNSRSACTCNTTCTAKYGHRATNAAGDDKVSECLQ